MITTFFTSKCNADFVITILSNALIFTVFVINYIFFAINIETIKDLLTQLQHVYEKLKNKYENAIFEKYSYYAKRCTILLITCGSCSIFGFIVTQFWYNIIDVVLSINISRSRRLPITTEYFIDQEKYFFLILLHSYTAFCVGVIAVLANGSMLLAYLIHICGLFKIASYRIEHAMRVDMSENISPKKDILILKEIICAVDIHRQAMKLSKVLVSRFEAMLFCLITVGVISLSLNFFQIFRIVDNISVGDNIDEILNPSLLVFISILYMFSANYMGQILTDHNKHVFVSVYNVQWYIAPLHIQRLILILLQRSTQEFTVGVGGLFVGSLECFATVREKISLRMHSVCLHINILDVESFSLLLYCHIFNAIRCKRFPKIELYFIEDIYTHRLYINYIDSQCIND